MKQDSLNTFLISPSSYRNKHCPTLPVNYQREMRTTQTMSKVSRPVRLRLMGRTWVGCKASVLRMGEPMNSRRRKKAEQFLPSRRRISSNNHNRLWKLCSLLFVDTLLTLADDGRGP